MAFHLIPIASHHIFRSGARYPVWISVVLPSTTIARKGPNFGIELHSTITKPRLLIIINLITIASINLYALPRSASHFQGSPNTGPFRGAIAPRPLWRLAPVIGPSPAKRETSGVSKYHRTHRILMARSLVVWPPQLRSNTGAGVVSAQEGIRAIHAAKQIGIQEASDWLMGGGMLK